MPMDTCPGSLPTSQEHTKQEIKPKMSSGRRSSKPLMEKRRRARINDSLCQLKSLILEATNKDTSRHSKLEKADILEMTVKYLRNMQRCRMSGSTNNSADLNRYRLGYSECINEVSRFLDSSEPAMQLRTQLIGHLANRCSPPASPVSQAPPQAVAFTPSPSPAPIVATAAMVPQASSHHSVQVQVAQQPQSVARSEIRVVLPPEALPNGQLPSHFIPVYTHSTPSPTSSTSSVETPPSPTRPSHSPAILQAHELSAPVSYDQHHGQHQQSVALAYMQGVAPATSSPLVGSTAPSTVQSTIGQTPTLVSLSAANAQTTATELRIPAQASLVRQQHHYEAVPQHHLFYQSSPQSGMKAENINVPQQCADESVWRPW